jgi:hypothetical protein
MDIPGITIIKTRMAGISITKGTGEKLLISGGTYMIVKNVAMLVQ